MSARPSKFWRDMPTWQARQPDLSPREFIAELDRIEAMAIAHERSVMNDERFSLSRRRVAQRNVAAFEARANG